MTLYVTITAVVVVLAWAADLAGRELRRRQPANNPGAADTPVRWGLSDVFIMSVLAGVAGLRFHVGTDYYIYANVFARLDTRDWATSIANSPHEAGYTIFSLLVKQISPDPSAIILATSVASVVPIYIAIRRLSGHRALSLLLYIGMGFYFISFNQVRQSIAVGLSALAYSYFGKSTWKFIALNALASAFHVSAIVVPLVQLVTATWKLRLRVITLVFAATAVGGSALTILANFADFLNPRYGGYIEEAEVAGTGTILMAAVRVAIVVVALLANVKKDLPMDLQRYGVYVALSAGLILMGFISIPVARLEMYFSIYMIFLLPALTARSRHPRLFMCILAILAIAHMLVYIPSFNGVLPYQTENGFQS
ncbi:EpsG family protein [Microbacterium sp. Sa4CUA7]|uniref:EpsG family protein n=1 Tax=Microbacterium pullorum TaxID=2762236 RepID=A0ABR8S554_9MICO|nr:EpsG family protein [Microbacterium pullorum]MBD7958580.1 EpsG family protein [Microbacterium pullorum]